MLLDEVQAGWGRCGDFMCYMTYGIKPTLSPWLRLWAAVCPSAASPAPTVSPLLSGPGTHGFHLCWPPRQLRRFLAVLRELKAGKWPGERQEGRRLLRC